MDDLKQKIINDLLEREDITLTDDQDEALSAFMSFYKSSEYRSAFLLTGSAGTGKTFMINLFTRFLRQSGFKVILLAPTGRAAKVITRRTQREAFTIHHHIYNVIESGFGDVSFSLRDNKEGSRTVYVVDEASMVGDQADGSTRRGLLLDLLEFVYGTDPERKLILVGDPVQLPPVGHNESPALSPDFLRHKGYLELFATHLSEVKRQMLDSEVLENAIRIRDAYLSGEPKGLQLMPRREVQVLENAWEGIENYLGYYEEGNPDRVIFITYSNYRAVQVNQAIRHQLFYQEQELLVPSDLLMVVKNNYTWGESKEFPFLANGEMCTVRTVYNDTLEEKYGLKWVNAELEFINSRQEAVLLEGKLVLDLLQTKQPQIESTVLANITFERRREYDGLPAKEAAQLFAKDPYINALQVKYGYAVTGHKAQGGQWENVLIGFEPDYGNDLQAYVRWTYTVFTRAEERVFLLDCPFVES